jgi:hypothetical protein
MQPASGEELFEIEGVLQAVDPINRELRVQHDGGSSTLDVPPNCTIVLNRERVKLRLLQPTDHVRVMFTRLRGRPTARRIEV